MSRNWCKHLFGNAPSAIWVITGTPSCCSSARATSVTTTPAAAATPVKPGDVCSFRRDLEMNLGHTVWSNGQGRTLISRPRNNELSKAIAGSTNSGSANSTYANLKEKLWVRDGSR